MHAGRAADRRIAGGDGAGALQQALERLGGGEIRPRRALADADRDEGLGDVLAASPAPARRPSPACRSPGTDRITTSAVSPASSLACRAPTVPKSNSTSWPAACANASPSAPTATCIERAHITLSLATLRLRPAYSAPGIGQGSARIVEKLSDLIKGPDLIVAPVALNPIMAQMAALAGFKAAYLSAAARSAGTRASPRPACRSPR